MAFLLLSMNSTPIGVFDSGYGGLTVLKELRKELPQYDYLYLGDNARAPYGNRSYETVYQYTLDCVRWLFQQGCQLIILACNTASAKALRTIQQQDLDVLAPNGRVLGVIRPTAEVIGSYTKTGAIGIMATNGTVQSGSYQLEIEKFFPSARIYQQACPMLVPLVENNEYDNIAGDYFIRKYIDALLKQAPDIDTILLACTHYPLLTERIKAALPQGICVISQGPIVARSLKDYLLRHSDLAEVSTKNATIEFYTTDSTTDFDNHSVTFFGSGVSSKHCHIG
jgi:glutamate racemase